MTADRASVETVLAWASGCNGAAYLVIENCISEHADFTCGRQSEQALPFLKLFSPVVIRMDYRLPDLENATLNHGVTLGEAAARATFAPERQKASLVMRAKS